MNHRRQMQQIQRIAQEELGYEQLRPGQEEVIQSILRGQDTLAVMPTGAGKSAIYQIGGLQLPGPTIVVSPLIALQRDQVEALSDVIGGAAMLNASIAAGRRREILEQLHAGKLEFLFLAPEQFQNDEMVEQLRAAKPSLFVVDEAHCISEWGYGFRPDYLRLGAMIEALGRPTVLALTATASPPVREEIVAHLGMRDPCVIVRGFDRPNIWLGVERFDDESTQMSSLLRRVIEAEKPGIVYAATRSHVEQIASALCDRGLLALAYHAGLRSSERDRIQQEFMADRAEVIVATIAFGMGIDKSNVRFVFHYDISDSVDSYYQEIGRAGRDGQLAQAVLFYRPADLGLRRFFAGGGLLDMAQFELVVRRLEDQSDPISSQELLNETGLSQSQLALAISYLEEIGAVSMLPDGGIAPQPYAPDREGIIEQVACLQERRRSYGRSRIEMIRGYAEARGCRREYLLTYFGEVFDGPCGCCDNCDAGIGIQRDENSEPFPVNSQVEHAEWGSGRVLRYEGDKIVVLFDQVGYKTLALDIVTDRGLLEARI